jgi:hypothetical protein
MVVYEILTTSSNKYITLVTNRKQMYYLSTVESLQSHMILTMSHWSSGLTCLLPATRVTGSNPLGGLM